ncbi:MAG TPA: YcxB family protein [Candidatus Dormibacteraeota bacterium]|nr:YcxB family protein [Candidatus Dormibacteraeota bacterium]
MSGPPHPPDPAAALPPLVLRSRPLPRYLWLTAAFYFLLTGTAFLARGLEGSVPGRLLVWRGAVGLVIGACAAYYTARYCFSRLIIDERGFRLRGPLGETEVPWSAVIEWRRRPRAGGLAANVLVVFGDGRRRLFIPLLYEESQALEVGLAQRGFPRY